MISEISALAVQFGGRRQYAIPNVLSNRNALAFFYTDFCQGIGLGRLVPCVNALKGGARGLDITNRSPAEQVLERTRIFPSWALGMRQALKESNAEARVRRIRKAHDAAALKMIRYGFHNSKYLISQFGEVLPLQRAARERGLVVVTDVNIAPSAEYIVQKEREIFPEWEAQEFYYGETLGEDSEWRRPMSAHLEFSNIFLCPSKFVQRDLIENYGVSAERARLVEYPVNPKWFSVDNNPIEGRVLFAGEATLRKGIHILAEAARILRDRRCRVEIVVAGAVAEHLRSKSECSALRFLGRLDGLRMAEEVSRADLFVLPSLAEGSAGVIYEAMGAGVPIITTFEAGSVLQHGVEGFIVPSRNAEALADAIWTLTQNRDLRASMALCARNTAGGYGWDSYETRLASGIFDMDDVCQ